MEPFKVFLCLISPKVNSGLKIQAYFNLRIKAAN